MHHSDDEIPAQKLHIEEEKFSEELKSDENQTMDNDENALLKKDVDEWTVDDVVSWLRSLKDGKFEKWVDLFKDNEVEGYELRRLNHDHLKRIGIKKYFDRVDILNEIETLNST